jgi:hypothetical protein
MSGKYTRRGQALLDSIERIQESFQMVNDASLSDIRRQVMAIKQTMTSIRNDFERTVKQLAKNRTNQNLVSRFGGVKRVKVADMDAEIAKLSGAENSSFSNIARRLNAIGARL